MMRLSGARGPRRISTRRPRAAPTSPSGNTSVRPRPSTPEASPWLSLQCSVQAEGTARIVTVAASIGTTDANHDGSERLHAACDRGFAVDFRHQAISLSEHDAPGRRNTEFEALRNPVGAIDEGIG